MGSEMCIRDRKKPRKMEAAGREGKARDTEYVRKEKKYKIKANM